MAERKYSTERPAPLPVTWTPERDARGASRATGPRCPAPACPVRWRGGPDRLCPDHAAEAGELDARAQSLARVPKGARWPRVDPPEPGELDDDVTPLPVLSRNHRASAPGARVAHLHADPEPEPALGEAVTGTDTLTVAASVPLGETVTGTDTLTVAASDAPLCACGCGQAFDPGSRPGRRFIDDTHRKRQQRRDERADHRELKAARPAAAPGTTVPPWQRQHGASVTGAFGSTATVSDG